MNNGVMKTRFLDKYQREYIVETLRYMNIELKKTLNLV
jgi:hypothetical protein